MLRGQGEESENNLKVVQVTCYPDYLVVWQDYSSYHCERTPRKLVIERSTHNVYEIEASAASPEEPDSCAVYSLLLGMLEINQRMHLVLCESVRPVCQVQGESIFEMGVPVFLELTP